MAYKSGSRKKEVTAKDLTQLRRELKETEQKITKMQEDFAEVMAEPQKAIFEAFGLGNPAEIGSTYDKIKAEVERKKHEKENPD